MENFIGTINTFGFNFIPRGWAACNGDLLSIPQNTTLFSLLGTLYGGDGRTNFAVPDLRGRVAMNQGRYPGSSFDWRMGQKVGEEMHSLTLAEMANHSHLASFTPGPQDTNASLEASTDAATLDTPTEGCYLAKNDGGRSSGVFLYRQDAGSTVKLGGVSGGSGAGGEVVLQSTGNGQQFPIFQPTLAVNYSISMTGIYPSRS